MTRIRSSLQAHGKKIAGAVLLLAMLVVAGASYPVWLPIARNWLAEQGVWPLAAREQADHDHAHGDAGHDHAGHDHDDGNAHDASVSDHAGHDHPGHEDSSALELSDVGWKNIGLRTGVIEPRTYVATAAVPAMVVERPGRSQVEITAPLTGIVTHVELIEGETVQPGQPLFRLRLTHEDLVTAQRDFLRSAEELDVVEGEIARLEAVGQEVIIGRRILEQKYEKQKIEAALHAQRQGLLLHGLTNEQVDDILETRKLLPDLTVFAPPFDEDLEHHDVEHLYHVQSIQVKRGQSVAAGETLAILADHCLLYVEGQAFEDDAERLVEAASGNRLLEVSPVADSGRNGQTQRLKVFYVADQVDRESRALRFYLSLPNQRSRDETTDGHRFVAWRYRPGQRMEVKVPVSQPWTDQIVLPPGAVVEEGAEAFVFEHNGDHFDRVPVHVVHRDKDAVVIENDGKLVGSTLALSGAYQMHLALKNKAGGGVDPHAGHSH